MEGMRTWWLAIALCACGDVSLNPDAAVPDAYEPDASVELTCEPGESQCSGVCADLKTDDLHCGACNNQCTPLQGCLDGACVDKASRCTSIRLWDPQAPDGLYFNPNTGAPVYCDFTNGRTYEDFRVGQYNVVQSGYNIARASDFAGPQFADAFIKFFNYYKGIRGNQTFSVGNCCVAAGVNSFLRLGANYMFLGSSVTAGNCVFNYAVNALYTLSRTQATGYMDTLPDDFFVVYPVTETAGCMDNNNPAIFFKRRNSLN